MLSPSGIMARQAWIVVLDAARRVAQRGNNRQDIFFGEIGGEIGDSHLFWGEIGDSHLFWEIGDSHLFLPHRGNRVHNFCVIWREICRVVQLCLADRKVLSHLGLGSVVTFDVVRRAKCLLHGAEGPCGDNSFLAL